jgi:hypothetical protein
MGLVRACGFPPLDRPSYGPVAISPPGVGYQKVYAHVYVHEGRKMIRTKFEGPEISEDLLLVRWVEESVKWRQHFGPRPASNKCSSRIPPEEEPQLAWEIKNGPDESTWNTQISNS